MRPVLLRCALAALGPLTHAGCSAGDGAAGEADAAVAEGTTLAPDGGSDACPHPDGVYQASFALVSGDCGPLDPTDLSLGLGAGGVTSQTQIRVDSRVVTDVVLAGCTLNLTQTIENADRAVLSELSGEGLRIEPDGTLTGRASFTRYDEGTGAPACSGVYDLTLSPSTTVVGSVGGGTARDAGAGAGDALDPMLVPEVEADCAQTVMCRAQRGEPLTDDPIADCVEATSALLAGDAERQAAFLMNRERCRQQIACAYVDCATAQ